MENTVVNWLKHTLKDKGKSVVFYDDNESVTFEQFDYITDKIASGLFHFENNKPIAVFMNRSIDVIEAYLGIVKNGKGYAPIDVNSPNERIKKILRILDGKLIITDTANYKRISDIICEMDSKYSVLLFNDLIQYEIMPKELDVIRNRQCNTDLLYIIFTSGSSGIPKAVATSHNSLMTYIDAYCEVMKITEIDRLASQAPLDYIAAIRDIYIPIYKGSSTYIIPKEYFMQPSILFDKLNFNRINCLGWSVSTFSILSSLKAYKDNTLHYVNKVCFSGSIMPNSVLIELMNNLSEDAVFVNQYGPTETTASCTYFEVPKNIDLDYVLPIGKPYKNYKVFLVDNNSIINEINKKGEICIAGPGVTLGYYNDLERTKKSFIKNPFNDYYDEIIYLSGDIGSYDEYGNLLFHGRKDRQIKYLGHRIELDEIEFVVNQLDSIQECCVVYDEIAEKVCLYYVGSITKKDVSIYLRNNLQGFMVPRIIVKIDCLPRLNNGKIDMVSIKQIKR